ncbi:sterol carrier protein domain-containing protein [Glutamicibacter halophytocola]|uniref:sterol carrier protein domain-containing protein n=1 Tax=Glutamicibacter halophytocola TaxID=1933880 RepID=UPI00321AEB66
MRSIDDVLWLRVLDVVAAFEARGYQHEAQLVLSVSDRLEMISGSYLFDVSDSHAAVSRIEEGHAPAGLPGVSLSERELAGLYLGSVQLGQLLDSGRAVLESGGQPGNWMDLFNAPREGFTPHGF